MDAIEKLEVHNQIKDSELLDSAQSRDPLIAKIISSTHSNDWRPAQSNDLDSFSKILSELGAEQRSHFLADKFLDFIGFIEMTDRYERIPKAYHKTFDWMFQETDEAAGNITAMPILEEPNSFVKWLQFPSNLYWIPGKPGSGKSTLMKYLYNNPKTKDYLYQWHQEHKLVMAGFFLWNSGTESQMSQMGMLRSLLHRAFVLPGIASFGIPKKMGCVPTHRWFSRAVILVGTNRSVEINCQRLYKTFCSLPGWPR